MPVPLGDIVCRFIRPKDWSTCESKPKARSLKQRVLSVWHEERLEEQGAVLSDLCIDSLSGSGQLRLSVADYLDIADNVASRIEDPIYIQVEWKPDDDFVKEPWRPWRDAHAQVEMIGTSLTHFPTEFRKLVIITAQRKGSIVPPEAA